MSRCQTPLQRQGGSGDLFVGVRSLRVGRELRIVDREAIYHVIARGNNKGAIVLGPSQDLRGVRR